MDQVFITSYCLATVFGHNPLCGIYRDLSVLAHTAILDILRSCVRAVRYEVKVVVAAHRTCSFHNNYLSRSTGSV